MELKKRYKNLPPLKKKIVLLVSAIFIYLLDAWLLGISALFSGIGQRGLNVFIALS